MTEKYSKTKKNSNKPEREWKQDIYKELEKLNRVNYLNVIEFDQTKLLNLINDMLKNRYAYIFNCQKKPEELVRKHATEFLD